MYSNKAKTVGKVLNNTLIIYILYVCLIFIFIHVFGENRPDKQK